MYYFLPDLHGLLLLECLLGLRLLEARGAQIFAAEHHDL